MVRSRPSVLTVGVLFFASYIEAGAEKAQVVGFISQNMSNRNGQSCQVCGSPDIKGAD